MAKHVRGYTPLLDPDFEDIGVQPLDEWAAWEERRKKAPVTTQFASPPGAKEAW